MALTTPTSAPSSTPTSPVPGGVGRVARTKGVSMLPDELEDAATVERLTGVGFSEVYRRHFAPQMRAAAELLRQAQDSGMELDRARLRDAWAVRMSEAELAAVYGAESELRLGD
jgi:hypothetical protein